MAVPLHTYTKILTALWKYGYLTALLTPKQTLNILHHIIYSHNDTSYIAALSGTALQQVNKTVSLLYVCVNSTIAANDTKKFWSCLTPTNTTSADKSVYCLNLGYDLTALVLYILVCLAMVFLLVMSFIEKRKYRQKCCHGRPGAVVPVNLLDSYENRFGNALAFGATTAHCLNVLIFDVKFVLGAKFGTVIDASPGYVSIFFKMLATIVIAVAAYPLFVCMRTPHKRAGSIFGIFYCLLWLSLQGYRFGKLSIECGSLSQRFVGMTALGELPQMLSLIALLGKFILTLIKALRRRAQRQGSAEDVYKNFRERYMYKHVQNLLKRAQEMSSTVDQTAKAKLKDKLYKWKPEFQYSTRVICAFTVSGIILYLLTVSLLYVCWIFQYRISKAKDFEVRVRAIVPNDTKIVQTVRTHLQIWTVSLYVAIILCTIKTVLVYLNMLACYRGHIMRLRRGDRSWLPLSIKSLNASPSSLVAASMKYAGFQVGYAAWGYLIFVLLIWLVLGILISFIFYPLFKGESSPLLSLLYDGWPYLLISLVVAFSQRLAAKFIFLQERGRTTFIDNRNAFHITCYFLFYFNIFLGLISFLLRIIKSVIFGVIFLERVQKSLLPRAFEKKDPGYFAYVGYILVEHSHANPVLCVFFYLLMQHAKEIDGDLITAKYRIFTNKSATFSENEFPTVCEEKHSIELKTNNRWKIVRNRWNLAYTLVNNPSLSQYRKQNLEKFQDERGCIGGEGTEIEVTMKKTDLPEVPSGTTPAVSI